MTLKQIPVKLNILINTLLAAGILIATVVVFIPKIAIAAPFDQKPVPTYNPVTSTDELTTASIPTNLVSEWRGLFKRPAISLVGKSQAIPGLTTKSGLKQYLLSWLTDKQAPIPTTTYKFNPSAIYDWTNTIAGSVNAESSEPSLKIENGRVTEFTPPQTGKALDRYDSTLKIINALSQGNTTADLTVRTTQPKKSLGSLNNLGITELIGRGESKFNGSPYNRRHNIKVGIKKMTGIIVKPNEEFSFNKYLGSVEKKDGYLPELVIKAEGTIPELGGGLCQVSSTTFRAAMHAGLPITQRRNHAYAVQYYAPQGSDATIYPGVVDFKFINDTGNSILIWPYLKDENYLIFDFYGTYDGRKVQLDTPYSYDKQSSGAMKSTWTRTVTLPGQEPKKDTFNSVYKSPALYHKQEQFVPATPPPGTVPEGVTPFVGNPGSGAIPPTTTDPEPSEPATQPQSLN